MKHNKTLIIFLLCLLTVLLTGCSNKKLKVVLHTGFAKNEVFKIENRTCTLPEMMVYLNTTKKRYEEVYGEQIWEAKWNEITMEESMKDMVLAQLSQIKAMNLLAEHEGVVLTQEEEAKVKEAAEEYYKTLSEKERKLLEVDKELISRLYQEYALANKVYYYIIKDINPEVSDDEARTITVDHILIKTYYLDENGNKVEYEEEAKKAAYQKIREAWQKAKDGIGFDSLIATYNEDSQSQYSFGKGEMNLEFETTAFNLGKGEISNIVETEYGYHIIKCITTFNQEETDANKIKIVEKKREEVFGERYRKFASELTKAVNESLWEKITLTDDENLSTSDFFEIYEQYFGKAFSIE